MKNSTATLAFPRFRMRFRGFRVAEFSMAVLLAVLMGAPVLFMLISSFNVAAPTKEATFGITNWVRAFSDPGTLSALWMSFLIAFVRLIPAIAISVVVAWLIARTDMPGGQTLEFLCWFAYFVPDFPMVLAWMLLLDPNYGVLNSVARYLPFVDGPIFNPYSFWGIIWVHTSVSGIWFKVMLLTPVFRRLGASLEEAARVAGADHLTTLRRVTLPVLSPMILAIAALSFIRGIESFNTELLLGIPVGIYVYATRIYDFTRQEPPAFGEATALGSVFLLVLIVLAFFYHRYLRGNRKFTVVTGQGYSTAPIKLGRWRYVALGGCLLYFSVMMLLPLMFLVIGSFMRRYGFFGIKSPFTFAHWQNMLADPVFFVSLENSLIIATLTALAGIVFYSLAAYLIVSKRSRSGQLIDLLTWLPWVVPGILMSLGLLWIFLATPLRIFLYGSI